MPEITFIDPAGGRHRVECPVGRSLMRAGRDGGVPGIVAECGGCMTCGTCHVHVAADALRLLPAPTEDERAMLDMFVDRDATSRLSCQLRMSEALSGITVRVSGSNG